MDFIRNFRFIIDYPHAVIYLKPGTNYPLYRAKPIVGLHLHYLHEKTYVQVDEGTVAYACGFRDGFKITSIDHHAMSELGYYRAYEALRAYVDQPVIVEVVDLEDHERQITLQGVKE